MSDPPEPAEPAEPAEPPARVRLEQAILGERPRYTAAQVALQAGVAEEEVRRVWRALGLPDQGDEATFTGADVRAIRGVQGLTGSGDVDFETAVQLIRAMGQTMTRLAEWEVATLLSRLGQLEQGSPHAGSRADAALRMVHELGAPLERLLVHAWRRHLAAAAGRADASADNPDDLNTLQVTVGFADIVSFTALSNDLEHSRIGDLVEIFEGRCADVVAAHGGRVVKSIGDSVLFVNAEPGNALETAAGIVAVVGRDKRMPDVRLGLASGWVVLRMGDVFGPPVNLAARLTQVARRNRIVADRATADQLPTERFEVRPMPARPIRGFGVVEPVAVRRL